MQESELDIVCVSELNADVVVTGAWPEPGHEVVAERGELVLGSSGAIFAADCVRLGLRVGICGLLGRDEIGLFVLRELERAGIETSGVVCRESARIGFTVSITGAGDRALLTFPGAMAEFGLADVELGLLRRCRHLHVTSPFLQVSLLPALPELLLEARNLGLTTSLDPGWDPRLRWRDLLPCLDLVDVFLLNEEEATALTAAAAFDDALDRLRRDARVVAIKLGANGAVAAADGDVYRARAVDSQLVDATGAGDGFDAAFVWAWLDGRTIPECLELGCLAGACVVQAPGGTAAFPSADQLEKSLRQHVRHLRR